ncbi:meiotic nuclear division protein [Anaeramoeba ignava]|uniref:Meiotic nuclear division protein n=1 Tax=Anaeramoeba ignava TaxID=1746090 RepID=A0A9Q0LCN4_ANAIG|nr:meiotic nuclear division protein [Anaeramoeba ignava]
MSKRGRVTAEEKRQKLLNFYRQSKTAFSSKEVENQVSKAVSISGPILKETNQYLIDENLIDTEKIGLSNFYWSFPSKIQQNKINLKKQLDKKLKQAKQSNEEYKTKIEELRPGREETEERHLIDEEISNLEEKVNELNVLVEKFRSLNPEVVFAMKKEAEIAKDAANRWTDNIYEVQSYVNKTFGIKSSDFSQKHYFAHFILWPLRFLSTAIIIGALFLANILCGVLFDNYKSAAFIILTILFFFTSLYGIFATRHYFENSICGDPKFPELIEGIGGSFLDLFAFIFFFPTLIGIFQTIPLFKAFKHTLKKQK